MNMHNIAIIPARGGSKGIPKKNLVDFCGKPLIAWTILQAKSAQGVDEVFVTTDNPEIAEVSKSYGAEIITRPPELAADTSTSEAALNHALLEIQKSHSRTIDYVVFLQATSPLRENSDIENALAKITEAQADSLFSAAELSDFLIWSQTGGRLQSVNYNYLNRRRRQEEERPQLAENGSIYVFKPEILLKHGNRLGGKICYSLMELWKAFEIDDYEGLKFCEDLFRIKLLKSQT